MARAVALVAVEMGYGHLRAAYALADTLDTEVLEMDKPPLASPAEQRSWARVRRAYELVSRASQWPVAGRPWRALLEGVTAIPYLRPGGHLEAPTLGVRALERRLRRGLASGLAAHLRASDATLVTTFYVPALVARYWGRERIVCVVTDADINRVWAPREPAESVIVYCVPSERAARRLRAFGVRAERIHVTGFPLPVELVGGEDLASLRRTVAARLVRLDPRGAFRTQAGGLLRHALGELPAEAERRPPRLTLAVGGAGAQVGLVRAMLPSLRGPLRDGRLQLALVAGLRREVAERLRRALAEAGIEEDGAAVQVLSETCFPAYYRSFNALLADTDVLWTKPSELTFYAALGIALVLAPPVGVHERLNRRWALHRGAALRQERPGDVWEWLREWLSDGSLAGTAWSGFARLPKLGAHRIADVVAALDGHAR